MIFRVIFQYIALLFHKRKGQNLRACCILLLVLLYGAAGFQYFEGGTGEVTLVDGLWYSLVTMTTVGYGDIFPKTPLGRFAVGVPLMFVGIGILGYILTTVSSALVFSQGQKRRGMGTTNLTGHIVIINVPGIAKVEQVIRELRRDPSIGGDTEVVIVAEDLDELPAVFQGHDVHFIKGNPTRDETLSRASIDQAAYVVILCRAPQDPASDNLNLAIALAIESRASQVVSAVECIDPGMEGLLRKAKCDRIVCLSKFESRFISHELLNPGAQSLIEDLICSADGQQLYITDLTSGPQLHTYADLRAWCQRSAHILIGIRRDKKQLLNPPDDTILAAGDAAITIGEHRLAFG
jgi:voltage-gated potassium channel